MSIADRVVARYVLALEVGQGTFTEHLKIHHFHGSVRITDMTNAGKRGKKVRELTVIASTHQDELASRIHQQAIKAILHMTYDQAKAHLEEVQKAYPNLFTLHESVMRGIDVEPAGTEIKMTNKFPNGEIVEIRSSPHSFLVKSGVPIQAPNKPAHGFMQDTLYSPASKQDGIIFYGWLKDNLSKAAKMSIMELRSLWDSIGVHYDYH